LKKSLILLPILFVAAKLYSQNAHGRAVSPAAGSAEVLAPTSLKVDGLSYARELDMIYWGDFEHVHMQRNGLEFGLMMSAYMHDFGVMCASALPKNKVEIMAQRCIEESYWVNRYGEMPGSRRCTQYETYGTRVYADPELYNATQFEDGKMATAVFAQLTSPMLKSGDAGVSAAMGNFMQTMDVQRQVGEFKSDLQQLLHNNSCAGAPLKRSEKNLIAFATGQPPIRMAGIPTNQSPFRDSDYQTLLDDLVSEQSKGWMFNRFLTNTISNVRVSLRDAEGQPLLLSANYAYTGSRGRAEGKVDLHFADGAPQCLVFSDVPDACRAVSHRIAAAYEDGKYVTDHPAETRTYTAPDLQQFDIVIDHSQPLQVEVSNKVLDMPKGVVYPIKGKLLADLRGIGPDGGSAVLAPVGNAVRLSVFNTQKGTDFYLVSTGDDPSHAINFKAAKQTRAGAETGPHDGSPITLAFNISPDIKTRMLLTDYKKNESAPSLTAATPAAAGPFAPRAGSGGAPGEAPQVANAAPVNKTLPAGTLLQLRFANAITNDQVASEKVFPATVVTTHAAFTATGRGETLPNGTTIFVRISPGSGNQYLIQGDHVIVDGVSIPLETNAQLRMAARTPLREQPVQVKVWGNIHIPVPASTASSTTIVVPPGTIVQLSTKTDVVLNSPPL
jgi:hypothetical protein